MPGKKSGSRKGRRKSRQESRPSKKPKIPIVERTDSRGLVEMNFPGFEITFPATNRSIMVIAVSAFCCLTIIIPVVFYEIFSAEPEALETVGSIFGGRGPKDQEPVKVPVTRENGDIEIIEVCPPCPVCECLDDGFDLDDLEPAPPPVKVIPVPKVIPAPKAAPMPTAAPPKLEAPVL